MRCWFVPGFVAVTWCAAGLALGESYQVKYSVPRNQRAAQIIKEVVVAKQPKRYIGWPDIVTTPSGELIAVFSGDRDWHVDPWGKVMAVRSTDGGKTWTEPELWIDTPLDDRGTGVAVFPDGELFLSYEAALTFATRTGPRYDPYKPHADTITQATRTQYKGYWGHRSLDNGVTWEVVAKMPGMIPHGPTVLDDGRLLLVGGGPAWESPDRGATWTQIGEVPKNEATWKSGYAFMSEPVSVQAADGRIIALARYKDGSDIELRQTESADGGRTWTEPRATGMQGFPAHLLRLENGWLLATYGRRIAPMGQRACISKDHGRTWLVDQEIVLSNAAPQGAGDLGYPASAQLADGSIWTVYYQVEKSSDGEYPALMGTHWRVKE